MSTGAGQAACSVSLLGWSCWHTYSMVVVSVRPGINATAGAGTAYNACDAAATISISPYSMHTSYVVANLHLLRVVALVSWRSYMWLDEE